MTSRTSRYFLGLLAMVAAHWASAVGLGEIRLLSAMDEPLRAEISLLNIGDLNESQIVAKLASPEDFKRSGVEREFQLTDLRFKVDLSNRANPVVRVTSQRPIKEPYLNFLIELNWTSGRLLREYTTLLDLPVFAGAQHAGKTAAAAPPAAAPRSRPEESFLQPEAPRRAPGHRAARATARPSTAATAGGTYRVQSGDTLWSIATRNQAPGVSIQQAMQAIVATNAEAFIQGNPNLIRRDAVLNLPDAAAMAAADSRAFAPSAQAARKTPSERPIESRTRAADNPASGNADGELRLSGGAGTDSSAGAAGRQSASGAGAARADLGTVLEERDRLERENAELKARVANLEEQAKAASRLVEIGDPGLAALQAGAQKAPADTAAPPVETPVAEQPAAPAKAPADAATPGTETAPTAAPAPVTPTPVAVPPPPAAPDMEEKFQDAITTLRAWLVPALGVAGALLLLIMGFAAWRGRTQQQGLELPREFEGKRAGVPQFNAEPVALADEDLLPDTHGFRENPDQILEEVDVCRSFGNEQQARELLTDALARHPEHAGLHLKMLELLVQEGDRPACEAMLPKLRALGDPRALETAVALMGELPAFDEAEPAAVVPSETVETFLHPAAARAETVPGEGVQAADFDLDLDLDLPEPSAVAETATRPQTDIPGTLDDLDLDLDFDLSGEDVLAEVPGIAAPAAAPAAAAEVAAEAHPAVPLEGGLDLFEPGQEMATQIELAEAYVDMGDAEGAREILDYVLEGGDEAQKESARLLLARLG